MENIFFELKIQDARNSSHTEWLLSIEIRTIDCSQLRALILQWHKYKESQNLGFPWPSKWTASPDASLSGNSGSWIMHYIFLNGITHIGSMWYIFTYIYHQYQPNVANYTIITFILWDSWLLAPYLSGSILHTKPPPPSLFEKGKHSYERTAKPAQRPHQRANICSWEWSWRGTQPSETNCAVCTSHPQCHKGKGIQ